MPQLIGIWCIGEWVQAGSPGTLQVVELGPGRGTLADDMLRVYHTHTHTHAGFNSHFLLEPGLADYPVDPEALTINFFVVFPVLLNNGKATITLGIGPHF